MRARWMAMGLFAMSSLMTSSAFAHVSVTGPAYAGQNQVLTFNIGHGCAGADTISLTVQIPEELTSVRALPSAWGGIEMGLDESDVITTITWSKDEARDADDIYYQVQLRAKMPDAPFTTLLFPATQVCRDSEGVETTVEWAATPEEIAAAPAGEEPEPAPMLMVLPVRAPGWNKYVAPDDITDLKIFDDAEIVWVGDAAYSGNTTTKQLIMDEDGVEVLTEIAADDEIWVKY